MAALQRFIRSMTPDYALRNARQEIIEHARVQREVDALVRRLPIPLGQVPTGQVPTGQMSDQTFSESLERLARAS